MIARKPFGQAPADPDIPEVIHNPAEDIPVAKAFVSASVHFGGQAQGTSVNALWKKGFNGERPKFDHNRHTGQQQVYLPLCPAANRMGLLEKIDLSTEKRALYTSLSLINFKKQKNKNTNPRNAPNENPQPLRPFAKPLRAALDGARTLLYKASSAKGKNVWQAGRGRIPLRFFFSLLSY
ncbi:hypothetical protein PA01_18720 [Azoarcus sp. PA01]|nr:hypothetical protein PA01_18720 [Azoarcus sp. PA01]